MLNPRSVFAKSGVAAAISLAVFTFAPDLAAAKTRLPKCPTNTQVLWTNCEGALTAANGDKYVGEFKDGRFSGQGTRYFADWIKYVGEFKDDKYN